MHDKNSDDNCGVCVHITPTVPCVVMTTFLVLHLNAACGNLCKITSGASATCYKHIHGSLSGVCASNFEHVEASIEPDWTSINNLTIKEVDFKINLMNLNNNSYNNY